MAQSSQQIADLIEVLSPEHRILRYVSKMESNIGNPIWQNDKNVVGVKTEGKLDIAKVKAHFIARNILTGVEFDDAVASGVLRGLISADLSSKGIELGEVNDILDVKQETASTELEAQHDAERLFTLEIEIREELRVNYSVRVNEILDTLINT